MVYILILYVIGCIIAFFVLTSGTEDNEIVPNIKIIKSLFWIFVLINKVYNLIGAALKLQFCYTDIKIKNINKYIEVIEIEEKDIVKKYITLNNMLEVIEYKNGFHADNKYAYYYSNGLVTRIELSFFNFDKDYKIISDIKSELIKRHEYEYKRSNKFKQHIINSIDI